MASNIKEENKVFNVKSVTLSQQMASACTGAVLCSFILTPLDVVRTRLQVQDRLQSKKCFLYTNGVMDHLIWKNKGEPPVALHTALEICNCKWYSPPKLFNGTLDAFTKIAKVEGITGLWGGLSPTLVLQVPSTVIFLTTYEQLKTKFVKNSTNLDKYDLMMISNSSIVARTCAVLAVSPLELIRTKMQSQKMGFKEVKKAVAITLKSEGLTGLWKGIGASMFRDVSFSAIYIPLFEYLRPRNPNSDDLSHFWNIFLASMISGGTAGLITLPADVIKIRYQLGLGETGIQMTTNQFVKEILSTHGFRGLFNGLVPRLLKVSPGCAIVMTTYEYCKSYCQKYD